MRDPPPEKAFQVGWVLSSSVRMSGLREIRMV
jgi:hypothetical protein